jgi:GT2 family glycosyltransferase
MTVFLRFMTQNSSLPPVAVVILNWNGKHYLEMFLPSLLASTYGNMKVYVADNGSTDDSLSFLSTNFPNVNIINNQSNEGFAGGYNKALKSVPEEYLVLLNSDIEVDPGWLEPVVEMWEKDKNLAAVQPKIKDYNKKTHFEYAGAAGGWIDRFGYPFSKGRIFDILEEDKGQYDQSTPIFWASGAALFIRHSAFDAAGGFDPYFFAHQEEIDLCWRLQLAGYSIRSCPDSVVYHIGGGTLPKNNPKKVFLNFRNNLIMLWKNLGIWEALRILPARFLLDAISAWKNLLDGQPSYFFAVMKSHFAFIQWLLFQQKKSVFPQHKTGKPTGKYDGSVVWQHFGKGKKLFSEIISEAI